MPTVVKFVLLVIGAALLALTARALLASKMRPKTPDEEPKVTIMLAAADLPAGLLLRAEDIDWESRPKSQVPDGAVKQNAPEADTLSGVLLRRDVRAGEAILARNVIRHDAPGFLAAALQPGMRAVSVPVDNVSGNAGLIQPGDFVDMILVQQSRSSELIDESRARSVVGETVIENVRVIAVGSVFQEESQSMFGGSTATSRQPVRTVTLEVMPRAAEAVTVAARLGSLTLALRSFAVTDPGARQHERTGAIVAWEADSERHQPVWASDVSRAIDPPPPPVAPAPETGDDADTAGAQRAALRAALKADAEAESPGRIITVMRGSESSALTLKRLEPAD
ncbi:MAG: Flp pilus assembly protein CpaB [Castellaniella sp.]